MELKIGEKIRELRKRDGRTQEEVASALGVSNQAVSKWESQNGYPDMETVPALANYFGVTIDELFGYESERDLKIRDICDRADKILNRREEMEECILLLREAAQEFPSNADILVRLGYALNYEGWRKYGGRSYTDGDHPNATPDTEYNRSNPYWEEAAAVFERTLGMDLKTEDRETVLPILLNIYSERGEVDKAEKLAQTTPTMRNAREVLLTMVWDENVERRHGECLLALLDLFWSQLVSATAGRTDIPEDEKIRLYQAAADLYKILIPDGIYLHCHAQLCQIYQFIVNCQQLKWYLEKGGEAGVSEEAMDSFVKCLDHYDAYYAAEGRGKVRFTAPLFKDVEWDSGTERSKTDYSGLLSVLRDLTAGLGSEFMDRLLAEPRIRKRLEGQKQVPQ